MTQNLANGVPAVPQAPMVDENRNPTGIWYTFFVNIWNRTGGAAGSISAILDTLVNVPGALLYRGASAWQGLAVGAQYQVLKVVSNFPVWSFLDGNSFGSQLNNTFFSGPSGAPGVPTFRLLASSDLLSVAGKIPGDITGTSAPSGDVGEYLTASVAPASAVSLTTNVAADVVTLTLSAGDWDVWSTVGFTFSGGATATYLSAWINKTSATDPGPSNAGAYVMLNPPSAYSAEQVFPVGTFHVLQTGTASVHLSVKTTFTGGTLASFGALMARRRR